MCISYFVKREAKKNNEMRFTLNKDKYIQIIVG